MITQQILNIGANSDTAKALALQLGESKTTSLILISHDFSAYDSRNNHLQSRPYYPHFICTAYYTKSIKFVPTQSLPAV